MSSAGGTRCVDEELATASGATVSRVARDEPAKQVPTMRGRKGEATKRASSTLIRHLDIFWFACLFSFSGMYWSSLGVVVDLHFQVLAAVHRARHTVNRCQQYVVFPIF